MRGREPEEKRVNHEQCVFCRIVKGELPSRKVYEDDQVLAFDDIYPVAPVHFMIIPKEHIQSIQPNCLVLANNAHDPKTTDIASYEVLAGGGLPPDGNKIPSEVSDCICTGNVSGNWFWHKTQNKDNLRSVESIMESFNVCESKYANYLLNVPPDATGRLPEIFVERLKEVGQRIETPATKP